MTSILLSRFHPSSLSLSLSHTHTHTHPLFPSPSLSLPSFLFLHQSDLLESCHSPHCVHPAGGVSSTRPTRCPGNRRPTCHWSHTLPQPGRRETPADFTRLVGNAVWNLTPFLYAICQDNKYVLVAKCLVNW